MKPIWLVGAALLALLVLEPAVHAQRVNFTYSGKLVTYTVPTTGLYRITAYGAQGASGTYDTFVGPGGLGAEIGGDFNLTAGETLQIAVGGAGSDNGGGGGGSFVVDPDNAPLIIAGGGGGGGAIASGATFPGGDGLTGPNGGNGMGGNGGAGGNGGTAADNPGSGGGAGVFLALAATVSSAAPAAGHFRALPGAIVVAVLAVGEAPVLSVWVVPVAAADTAAGAAVFGPLVSMVLAVVVAAR